MRGFSGLSCSCLVQFHGSCTFEGRVLQSTSGSLQFMPPAPLKDVSSKPLQLTWSLSTLAHVRDVSEARQPLPLVSSEARQFPALRLPYSAHLTGMFPRTFPEAHQSPLLQFLDSLHPTEMLSSMSSEAYQFPLMQFLGACTLDEDIFVHAFQTQQLPLLQFLDSLHTCQTKWFPRARWFPNRRRICRRIGTGSDALLFSRAIAHPRAASSWRLNGLFLE